MSRLEEILKKQREEREKRNTSLGNLQSSHSPAPISNINPILQEYQETNLMDAMDEGFDLGDFVSTFTQHAVESGTFGLSRVAGLTETEPWEEKSNTEKVAAGLGEFAGMMNPFTGVRLVGSALGKGIGFATRQGTKQIVQDSAKKAAATKLKKGLSKKGVDDITTALNKSVYDDVSKPGINQLSLGGEAAETIIETVGQNARARLAKIASDNNISMSAKYLDNIVNTFKQGIREGKHINNADKWMSNLLGVDKMPLGMKKNFVKWLGMAGAETVQFGLYSTLAGQARELTLGENFGPSELYNAWAHAAFFSGADTAIQGAANFGGKLTIRQGLSGIINAYRGANYAKIAAGKNGKQTLHTFIKSLRGGTTKNLMAGKKWKVGEKSINVYDDFEIDKLTAKESAELLENMRKFVTGREGIAKYGKEWAKDFAGALPAMTLGAFVNNLEFMRDPRTNRWKSKDQFFDDLSYAEIAYHSAMGAFFTRTRGQWNHGSEPTPALKDWYAVSNAMGLNTDALAGRVAQINAGDFHAQVGGGLHRNPATSKMYNIIENTRAAVEENKRNGEPLTEINPFTEGDLELARQIHYTMDLARQNNPYDYDPLELRYLTKEQRVELLADLKEIKITDTIEGKPKYLGDFSATQVEDFIAIQLGEGGAYNYKLFFKKLKEDGLIDIDVDEVSGKITAPSLNFDQMKDPNILLTGLDAVLNRFERLGMLERSASKAFDPTIFEGVSGAENRARLDARVQEFTQQLKEGAYGKGVEDIPDFDPFNNHILGDIEEGSSRKNLMALFDINMSNIDQLSNDQITIVETLKNILKVEGGLISNPSLQIRIKRGDEDVNVNALDTKQQDAIAKFEILTDLFLDGRSDKEGDAVKSVDLVDITRAVDLIERSGLINESILDPGFNDRFNDYKIRRLSNQVVSPAKFGIISKLMEDHEWAINRDTKEIQIMSAEGKRLQLINEGGFDPTVASKAAERWQQIIDLIGTGNGKIKYVEEITFPREDVGRIDSPQSIDIIWNSLPKQMAKLIDGPLANVKEKLNLVDENGRMDFSRSIVNSLVEDLNTSLKNFSDTDGASGVESIEVALQALKNKVSTESNDMRIFNGLTKSIQKIVDGQITFEQLSQEFIEGPDGRQYDPGQAFRYLMANDSYAANELNGLITQMIYQSKGKGSVQAYETFQGLRKELAKKLDIELTSETSLEELVDKYNTTRSFKDFKMVIRSFQKSLSQTQLLNKEVEFDNDLHSNFSKFIERYSYTSPTRQMGAYIEKYNMLGKMGEPIDQYILNEVNLALDSNDTARLDALKDKIIDENITQSVGSLADKENMAKLQELTSSFQKDWILIVDHLSGTELVPVGKVSEGMIEYDLARPTIRGPRSDFRREAASFGILKLFELETTAVDNGQSKHIAQIELNERLASDRPLLARVSATKDMQKDVASGDKIDASDFIVDFTDVPNPSNSVSIMVSEGNSFLFEKTPHNIQKLNDWFNTWRAGKEQVWQEKINKMSEKDVRLEQIKLNNWRDSMETLANSEGTSSKSVVLKLRSLYWDTALPNVYENRFTNDLMTNRTAREAFDDKFYKRLKLYEGGNMHPFSENVLDYISRQADNNNGPGDADYNARLYAASKNILDNGLKTAAIGDEIDNDPTWTVSTARDKELQDRIKAETDPLAKQDLEEQLKELQELRDGDENYMQSLDASTFNAATFIDEDLAMVLSARIGQEFDPSKINGWKPIGYYKDPGTGNLVAMKTWLVYSPRKAELLKSKGLNILTTQSAAKMFMGVDNAGNKLDFLKFKDKSNWEGELRSLDMSSGKNVISLPINALSIGSNNHPDRGVSVMHSLNNFANPRAALDLMEYQQLDYILGEISYYSKQQLDNAKIEIARGLSEYKNTTEGVSILSETQSMAEGLLNVGMRTDNPIIKDVINRAFMTQAMNMIRRPQDKNGGTSSYLIAEDLNFIWHGENKDALSGPIFRRMESELPEIDGIDTRINNIRIQTQLGGIAQSYDWGLKEVNNIKNVRLVAKISGIDHIIGFDEKGRPDIINPYDVITSQNNVKNPRLKGETKTRTFNKPKELDFIYKEIKTLIENGKISTNNDVFNLLQEGFINGERIFSDRIMKAVKKLNLGQMVNTVAIPRKSLDVAANRVEHILNPDYSNHVVTNDYEVAVTHQRDFDMDHIYTYSNLPMSYTRQAYEMGGIVIDYKKYDRNPVPVDPFLQGNTTSASDFGSSTGDGLSEYVARRQSQKMAIGTFVGISQPLTSLSNIGFKFTALGSEKMNYVPSRENINNVAQFIERNGNVVQTNVDPFGGTAKLFDDLNSVEKFVLFGEVNDLAKENQIPEHYTSDTKKPYKPVFTIDAKTTLDRSVQQDVITAVITKMRRAQSLFNDIYENGVQRSLTPWDINRHYRDMSNLLGSNGNKHIFMSLFKQYQRRGMTSEIESLTKLFFGGADKKDTRYGLHAKGIVEKIINDIRAGKFWSKENVIDKVFEFDKGTTSELMNKFASGKILDSFNSKQTFAEKNISSSGLKSDIVGDTRNLIDSITMLRFLGEGEESLYRSIEEGKVEYGLKNILGKDIRAHENRGVAYTYLNNRHREVVQNLEYNKSMNRNKSNTKIESLQNELASVVIAMNAIQKASMNQLGQKIEEIGQRNAPIKARRNRFYKNRSKRDVVIYRVNKFADKIDESFIKSLEYGKPGGLQFYANVNANASQNLEGGHTYIILENPLFAKNMEAKDVKNAYAWHLTTRDIHWDNYMAPENHPQFVEDIKTVMEKIDYSFRMRRDQAKDSAVFAKEIWMEAGLEEQNLLSEVFRKWGQDKDTKSFDEKMVTNIALQLLAPEGIPRSVVKGEGASLLPAFKVNKRLQKAVLKWVTDNGFVDLLADRIQMHSDYYASLHEGVSPKDADLLNRADMLHSNDWDNQFYKYGERSSFVSNLLSDKFNLVRGPIADLIRSQGIVRTRRGSYVNLYSGEGMNMSSKMQKYEPITSTANKNKEVYWCP